MWADFITCWRLASSVSKPTYTGVWSIGPIKCVHRGDVFERLRREGETLCGEESLWNKDTMACFHPRLTVSEQKQPEQKLCCRNNMSPTTAARTKHKIIVVWWDDDKPRIPGLSRHRVIQGLTWDNISLESCLSRISDILGCSQLCIPVLPRPLPQLSTPWGCCHQSSPSLSQFVCYLSSSVISETN